MRAGLYGNIGALLMGAAGRMEDALEYTEKSIEAGREINIPDSTLTAGAARHVTCVLYPLEGPLCVLGAGSICFAPILLTHAAKLRSQDIAAVTVAL